jgi:hypothetical protein
MAKFGQRKTYTMDYDRSVTGTFSGDDADKYSDYFDLGDIFNHVIVELPTITSSTVGIKKHTELIVSDPTEVPVAVEFLLDNNTSAPLAFTAGTAAKVCIMPVGAMQFGRLYFATNQAADRIFSVQGMNL